MTPKEKQEHLEAMWLIANVLSDKLGGVRWVDECALFERPVLKAVGRKEWIDLWEDTYAIRLHGADLNIPIPPHIFKYDSEKCLKLVYGACDLVVEHLKAAEMRQEEEPQLTVWRHENGMMVPRPFESHPPLFDILDPNRRTPWDNFDFQSGSVGRGEDPLNQREWINGAWRVRNDGIGGMKVEPIEEEDLYEVTGPGDE